MCINKNKELLPYYYKIKSSVIYNKETGVFTWSKPMYHNVKKGSIADSRQGTGYKHIGATINGIRKRIKSHRLAWYIVYGELPDIIDHIDGNGMNNKISNLRSCSHRENQLNRGVQLNNKSGYKGVSYCKLSNKWKAQITHKKEKIYLGLFPSALEASKAYERKALELFKGFYQPKGEIRNEN